MLFFSLLLGLSIVGCSRSLWVKADGHEVSPNEQLECSIHVQEANKSQDYVDQVTLKQQIEQCMINKGYNQRPWWLLNDAHWRAR